MRSMWGSPPNDSLVSQAAPASSGAQHHPEADHVVARVRIGNWLALLRIREWHDADLHPERSVRGQVAYLEEQVRDRAHRADRRHVCHGRSADASGARLNLTSRTKIRKRLWRWSQAPSDCVARHGQTRAGVGWSVLSECMMPP